MNTARIQRTVLEMRAAGLTQLIVSAPSSVFYYTGKWVHPGERMLALLIRDSGDAALYANRLFALSSAFSGDLVEYDDTDDCVSVLAQGLGDGVLGIVSPHHRHIEALKDAIEAREDCSKVQPLELPPTRYSSELSSSAKKVIVPSPFSVRVRRSSPRSWRGAP